MKRFAKPALAAGAFALALSMFTPQQAQAGNYNGRVAAGAILGLATGAIIASSINRSRYYGYYGPGYTSYYYPPYYPSGPVYYSYDAYYPNAGYPALGYYGRPYRYYQGPYYNDGPYNGIGSQLQMNPYHPNW
jgi:hypothetical protein